MRRVGLGVGLRRDDDEVTEVAVGDERFLPVEDVVIAAADRGRSDGREITPRRGLRHRHCGDDLALRAAGQPSPFLLLVTERVEVGDDNLGMQGEGHSARARTRQFLDDDHGIEEVGSWATPLLVQPAA